MNVNRVKAIAFVLGVIIAFYGGWQIRGLHFSSNYPNQTDASDYGVTSAASTDESATFNTIDSILLQAISYRKAKDHYPEFGLIEIPISASIKRGHIFDQYGREIRYNVTGDTLEVRSSGKDGVFGTDDDIIGVVSPDQTGRHINGKFETFALEVEP